MTFAELLEIKHFPIITTIDKGTTVITYKEYRGGFWEIMEVNKHGQIILKKDSSGFWSKYKYDHIQRLIKYEDSNEYWYEFKYDDERKTILFTDSSKISWFQNKNIDNEIIVK